MASSLSLPLARVSAREITTSPATPLCRRVAPPQGQHGMAALPDIHGAPRATWALFLKEEQEERYTAAEVNWASSASWTLRLQQQ